MSFLFEKDITDNLRASFLQIKGAIERADTIGICAHTKPDGDAFGSVLALSHILEAAYPNKEIVRLLADDEVPSATFSFLNCEKAFVYPKDLEGVAFDLFIALDTPLKKRLGHAAKIADGAKKIISFDHHLSREPFAEISVIDPAAAATGYLVGLFLVYLEGSLGKLMSQTIANDLFLALMTDTGRFQYQNTSAEVLSMASWLVFAGANPSFLSAEIYQNESLPLLKLKARVMERISFNPQARFAYSYATLHDFSELDLRPTDADGLVDVVRSVAGADVALFLKEIEGGETVRGNLRAKGDMDVASIAEAFGGGGHRAAAGFSAKGTLSEIAAQVEALLVHAAKAERPSAREA